MFGLEGFYFFTAALSYHQILKLLNNKIKFQDQTATRGRKRLSVQLKPKMPLKRKKIIVQNVSSEKDVEVRKHFLQIKNLTLQTNIFPGSTINQCLEGR